MTRTRRRCSPRSGAASSRCLSGSAPARATSSRPCCGATPPDAWWCRTCCRTRGWPGPRATTRSETPPTTPSPPCSCNHRATALSLRRRAPPRRPTRLVCSACRASSTCNVYLFGGLDVNHGAACENSSGLFNSIFLSLSLSSKPSTCITCIMPSFEIYQIAPSIQSIIFILPQSWSCFHEELNLATNCHLCSMSAWLAESEEFAVQFVVL